jgi:hypothetical protein
MRPNANGEFTVDDSHGGRPIESEEHPMTKESRWLALFVVVAVAAALQAPLAATEAPNPARAPQTVPRARC